MESVFALGMSAFALGAMHALEPGHGKTAMVGALLGSKHRWLDPIRLGLAAALGHAFGMAAIALLSFSLAHHYAPAQLREYFELGIGGTLLLYGFYNLVTLYMNNSLKAKEASCSCCKKSSHGIRGLPAIGFLVGFVPCPSAVALSMSAVSLGSPQRVMMLAVMFGIGVASALALIGILITHSSQKLLKVSILDWLGRNSSLISATIFMLVGALMILHAELRLGHEVHLH